MGTSTDGLVWFGMCWTQKHDKYYSHGFPDRVSRHLKVGEGELEEFNKEEPDTHALAAYVNTLLKEFGCRVVLHCSGDYPMVGLALEEHYHAAHRGHPEPLDYSKIQQANTAVNVERLRKACEMLDWPWEEPQWWLASDWG